MSSEKLNWGLFLLVGLSFIVLGIVGISLPQLTAIAIDLLIGWLLVFGGILQGIHAVKCRQWKGFFLSTLGTVLYLGAGAFLLIEPLQGIVTLTLLLALLFMFEGGLKLSLAFQMRPQTGWVWPLISGILAIVLALLIWAEWPSSAAWAIGLLFGINMLFAGWTTIMLGVTFRETT